MRIISRLDVKAPNLVKGINFEGLKKLGDPSDYIKRYYHQGIDEIILIDIVASLYNRNSLLDVISNITKEVFVPITVGGGIKNIKDIKEILRSGADKVALNTSIIKEPEFINRSSSEFGNQCIVGSIQAKKKINNNWEAYYDCGREKSGKDAVAWAVELASRGVGEILISSVDRDGTLNGPDFELIEIIRKNVDIPIIAASGLSNVNEIYKLYQIEIDAVAIGSAFHYEKLKINNVKKELKIKKVPIRI